MGKIFGMFAYAAAFCLVVSLIESKPILPAHLANLKMTPSSRNNPVAKGWTHLQGKISAGMHYWIKKIYRPFIHQALQLRYATLIPALTIFVLIVGMVPAGKIRAVFFPDIPENTVQVILTLEDEAGFGLVQQQAVEIEKIGLQLGKDLQHSTNSTNHLFYT